MKDTIKIADGDAFVTRTPNRSSLWQVQTPQAFSYPLIFWAYEELFGNEKGEPEGVVTDDAMVLERSLSFRKTGQRVKLVEGSYENIKITTPSDLQVAEQFMCR